MKGAQFRVSFQPTGRHIFALRGTKLLEAAARCGLILQTPCGGEGICGKCRVRVVGGDCPPSSECLRKFGAREIEAGFRLACQAEVRGELVVEIPEASLFETQQQILTGDSGEALDIKSSIKKQYVELSVPEQADSTADLERLSAALDQSSFTRAEPGVLRALPDQLRARSFKGTAVVADDELIDFEVGDTASLCYGVAFDLGTTTIVGTLVNLATGESIAVEACLNPQTSLGDDVISRIKKCRDDSSFVDKLRDAVLGAVNKVIEKLATERAISVEDIYEVVLAGNTTMQQIACGITPAALGELPFVPAFRNGLHLKAAELGIEIHRNGRAFVFPQIGGFVGGDTVAGIVAARLDREQAPVLLVDVGTNGEIVLAHDGRLVATSVAAGPAFEGARISCGMRATAGAVEKVIIADDLFVSVIRNVRPAGLCGSGLIDAISEMLRAGVLHPTGRILPPDEAPAALSEPIRKRLLQRDGHVDFMLLSSDQTATGEPLVLTQKDIREFQLANGAIRAGINILLRTEGVLVEQLGQVLLAGAFGNYIRRNNAQRVGLLPDLPQNRIRFIGNASSLGAKRALLSAVEKDYADSIANKTRHLDLSLSSDFQLEFGSAMLFPE